MEFEGCMFKDQDQQCNYSAKFNVIHTNKRPSPHPTVLEGNLILKLAIKEDG